MTKRNLLTIFLGAGLVFSVTQLNFAQPIPGRHSVAAQRQQQVQEEQQKTFTGKIAQSEGKFVLQDSSGATYNLDDQEKAKQFDGKNVKVTGTLDADGHTIHVSDIQAA